MPDWDNQKALTIFEQMLQKTNNKIDGVLAANDGLGNSVISALKARKLKQIPVTGQDATPQGIQNILAGDQCMTVYKAVKKEADAASKLAIALAKGKQPPAGLVNGKTERRRASDVPSVLLTPVAITKDNIKVVFDDGFLKPSEVCVGKYAALCTKAGIARPDGDGAPPRRRPTVHGTRRRVRERDRHTHPGAAGVSKSFGAVQALYEVDFHVSRRRGHGPRRRQRRRQVDPHQVHRRHLPDRRGRGPLRGRAASTSTGRRTPPRLGIEVVYQDLALADNLDVVQNMFLGREETHGPAARARRDHDGEARQRDARRRCR